MCASVAGRTRRAVQNEQTGKGGHSGDDGEVLEAEGNGAAVTSVVQAGRVSGRVQTVHGTGAGTLGGTVDGRATTAVGPTDGRALGIVRATVKRADEPLIIRRPFRTPGRNCRVTSYAGPTDELVLVVLLLFVRRRQRRGRAHHRGRGHVQAVTQPAHHRVL